MAAGCDLGVADVHAVEVAHRQRRPGPAPPAAGAGVNDELGEGRHAIHANGWGERDGGRKCSVRKV
jgi:hypothetical protein